MTIAVLLANIETKAIPFLKSKGFSGKEVHWVRYRAPFIDCVEFQIRSDKRAYCVNLGVHLDFLPAPSGETRNDIADVTESDCEIRQRLSPTNTVDYWWDMTDTDETEAMLECLKSRGISFFENYTNLPDCFSKINLDNLDGDICMALLPTMTKVRRVLLLARIYDYLGDSEHALEWAQFGKEIAGEGCWS